MNSGKLRERESGNELGCHGFDELMIKFELQRDEEAHVTISYKILRKIKIMTCDSTIFGIQSQNNKTVVEVEKRGGAKKNLSFD